VPAHHLHSAQSFFFKALWIVPTQGLRSNRWAQGPPINVILEYDLLQTAQAATGLVRLSATVLESYNFFVKIV